MQGEGIGTEGTTDDLLIEELSDELVLSALDDWSSVAELNSEIHEAQKRHRIELSDNDRVDLGLKVLERCLAKGWIVLGKLHVDGFERWNLGRAQELARVELSWRGQEDQLAAFGPWIEATTLGEKRAAGVRDDVLRRVGWVPEVTDE